MTSSFHRRSQRTLQRKQVPLDPWRKGRGWAGFSEIQRGWRNMRKRSWTPEVPVLRTLASFRETSQPFSGFCNAKYSPLLLLLIPSVCRPIPPGHHRTSTARQSRQQNNYSPSLSSFPWESAVASHHQLPCTEVRNQWAALITCFKVTSLSILDSTWMENYWREQWVIIPQGTSLGFTPPSFPSLYLQQKNGRNSNTKQSHFSLGENKNPTKTKTKTNNETWKPHSFELRLLLSAHLKTLARSSVLK